MLLMANGPHRITNGPFDPELYKSEHEVQDPELRVSYITLSISGTTHNHLIILKYLFVFYRLYYRALQAVKHRRRRKRRYDFSFHFTLNCVLLNKCIMKPSTSHVLIFTSLFSHPTGLQDSRKCDWTANWRNRSSRINTAFPHVQDPKEKQEKTRQVSPELISQIKLANS